MFDKIKRNFGFGCMRLPMNGSEVDTEQVNMMVDRFMEAGFNYFDTAHGYIDGKSEKAVRECLTSRYPRESYVLANKLSDWFFTEEKEILPLFEQQLEICGVEYFDFYLLHSLHRGSYEKYKTCRAFETVSQLKKEGKVKHIATLSSDIYTLEKDGKEILFPAVKGVVTSVDIAAGQMTVDKKRFEEVAVL